MIQRFLKSILSVIAIPEFKMPTIKLPKISFSLPHITLPTLVLPVKRITTTLGAINTAAKIAKIYD